jgi:hypothetical protein
LDPNNANSYVGGPGWARTRPSQGLKQCVRYLNSATKHCVWPSCFLSLLQPECTRESCSFGVLYTHTQTGWREKRLGGGVVEGELVHGARRRPAQAGSRRQLQVNQLPGRNGSASTATGSASICPAKHLPHPPPASLPLLLLPPASLVFPASMT